MNGKDYIKRVLSLFPFAHTEQYHILELRRKDWHAGTETNDYCNFRYAKFETDFESIAEHFPEELNRTNIEGRIKERFDQEMPCFVALDQQTEELYGAVWGNPHGYSFLSEYADQPVFWITNLFVRSDVQGKRVGKSLLQFAINRLFSNTDCAVILSQIHLTREASLRVHTQVGFQIVGQYRESHIGNNWFGTFKRN